MTLPKELEARLRKTADTGRFYKRTAGMPDTVRLLRSDVDAVLIVAAEHDAEIARLTGLFYDLAKARETAEARASELQTALAESASEIEAQRKRVKELEAALETAAKIARDGCLVPPDGGAPTEAEADMCARIAANIRILKGDTTHAAE